MLMERVLRHGNGDNQGSWQALLNLRWQGPASAVNFWPMKMPGRIILPAALAALATSSWAQQSPGLSIKPSGRILAEPTAPPAEQPVDLTRPNPQAATQGTAEEDVYLDAAMQGHAWAQTRLGKLYTESPDDSLRWDKGVELLKKAANQDDAEALLVLSRLAAQGKVMPQSFSEAFGYCSRAAQAGSPEAQHRLAGMYAEGLGVTKDRDAALSWSRRSAKAGYTPAKYGLAMALMGPDRTEESTAEAMSWFRSAAEDGHEESLFLLAGATAHGHYGLAKDEKKAEQMALPKAEAGNAEFQYALATLYLRGETFAENRADGMRWLERAASNGHASATKLLATMKNPPP